MDEKKYIAACTTRTIVKNFNLMFYQCTISQEQLNDPEKYTLQDTTFVKIDVFSFAFYITLENVDYIVNYPSKYFIVHDTPQWLPFTMEKIAADRHTGAQLSGHHCQEGTNKRISVVFPIKF
jgi:hypothetical protein